MKAVTLRGISRIDITNGLETAVSWIVTFSRDRQLWFVDGWGVLRASSWSMVRGPGNGGRKDDGAR